MKWLAAGAAIVIVVGVLLLRSVLTDDAPPAANDQPVAAASARDGSSPPRPVIADARPAVAHIEDDPEGPQPAWPEIPDARTDVFLAMGAEFYERVDDYSRQRFPAMLSDCYKGGEHPKAKLKLHYWLTVERHVVTVTDVSVVEGSTVKSQAVIDCMVKQLKGVRFEDTNMPDFVSPQNDPQTVRIRIEALKRFYPEQDEGTR